MTEQRRLVRDGYNAIADVYTNSRETSEEPFLGLAGKLDRNALILDAGCGAGIPATRELIDHGTVVGLDLSRAQLQLARQNVPCAATVQGDMTSLPFPHNTFDAVVSFHAVIHLPLNDHINTFTEFARVLRPGGWALLTSGVGAWSGTNSDWLETGTTMRWSFPDQEQTIEWLVDAGFVVERTDVLADGLGPGEWLYILARVDWE